MWLFVTPPIYRSRDLAHAQSVVWSLTQNGALFWRITGFMLTVVYSHLTGKVNRQGQGFQIL